MSEHKDQDNRADRDDASDPFTRQWLDGIADRFESGWKAVRQGATPPQLEDYVAEPDDPRGAALLCELIGLDIDYRRLRGETPQPEDYLGRFPRLDRAWLKSALQVSQTEPEPTAPAINQPIAASPAETLPTSVGRYRPVSKLGEGGFGTVYLADDPQLQRRVAIKVPRPDKHWTPEQLDEYRREAQVLAKFEHENIVRVFDIGCDTNFPVYIVSQFIDGTPLNRMVSGFHSEKNYRYIARLIAMLAGALDYAHQRGVVHRDLKPANVILRNRDFQVFLTDFGLALRDEETDSGLVCGTPGYASPEQVSGEGHRIDGRSDLYSLGVILHELLTGRVPFAKKPEHARNVMAAWTSYRERVRHADVKPLRQLDPNIPRELERIGLKLLERRASDRYSCASDFIDDLHAYIDATPCPDNSSDTESMKSISAAAGVSALGAGLTALGEGLVALGAGLPTPQSPRPQVFPTPGAVATPDTSAPTPMPTPPLSDELVLKIVPKGLRSFDEGDKDFFLDLLPGARDRDGLPESIRFWKTRIEATDAEKAFSVGVLYGPSGCGKSSLLKAGLLPRLSERVLTVNLEATSHSTEEIIRARVAKVCDLSTESSKTLESALRTVRQGTGVPSRGKLLIVIDQFEQWLHANREQAWTSLAFALRQCDGVHVQCLLLVRDDFWLAISRFLQELEVPLVEGVNCTMADLFDPPHAKRVLGAFGTAYGVLSPHVKDWSAAQREFIDQSVSGLATENKIISVRLTLFAEMVKSKPWTPKTLRDLGGVTGIGVTFLEETFSAKTAKIAYRTHEVAVRKVLKALVPDADTDIKGHQVSQDELLQHSGYTKRPRDFELLLHILDRDLRLITPVSDECESGGEGPTDSDPTAAVTLSRAFSHSYQLAHDYLVPSIQEWLKLKQKETRRGRAELLLSAREKDWYRRRDRRLLPSRTELLSIVLLTNRLRWNSIQKDMLRSAAKNLVIQSVVEVVLTLLIVFIGYNTYQTVSVKILLSGALIDDQTTDDIEQTTARLHQYPHAATRLLHNALISGKLDEVKTNRSTILMYLISLDSKNIGRFHREIVDEIVLPQNADGSLLQYLLKEKLFRIDRIDPIIQELRLRLPSSESFAEFRCRARVFTQLVEGNWSREQVVAELLNASQPFSLEELHSLSNFWDPEGQIGTQRVRELLNIVAADQTISETVRHRATELAGLYWENDIRHQATLLLDPLFGKGLLREEVMQTITDDKTITQPVRVRALELAESRVENANALNHASWTAVSKSDQSMEQYHLALRRAEAAHRITPNNAMILNTLGVAQFRVGQYEAALKSLTRSDALHLKSPSQSQPADVAFLAMVEHKLGHQDPARVWLDRLLEIMKQPQWGNSAESQALLHEAVSVLDATLTQSEQHALAHIYEKSGRLDRALPLYEQSFHLCLQSFGTNDATTLKYQNCLALAYREAGKYEKVVPVREAILNTRRAEFGEDHPNTLTEKNKLAVAYEWAQKLDEAIPLYEATLQARRMKLGEDHADTLQSKKNLAWAYRLIGKFELVVPLREEVLKSHRDSLGVDHRTTLEASNAVAVAYSMANRLDDAVSLYEKTMETQRTEFGEDDAQTLLIKSNLASAYRELKKPELSLALYEDIFTRRQTKLGANHAETLAAKDQLAIAYELAKKFDQALPLYETLLKTTAAMQPRDEAAYSGRLASVGNCLLFLDRFADAETKLRECLTIREKVMPGQWRTANAQRLLGIALAGQQKFDEAEKLINDGLAGLLPQATQLPKDGPMGFRETSDLLVEIYTDANKPDQAKQWRTRVDEAQAAFAAEDEKRRNAKSLVK